MELCDVFFDFFAPPPPAISIAHFAIDFEDQFATEFHSAYSSLRLLCPLPPPILFAFVRNSFDADRWRWWAIRRTSRTRRSRFRQGQLSSVCAKLGTSRLIRPATHRQQICRTYIGRV